ncbi:MAG: glycine zipper 2TM domain-containing protein [gamma proteobacterium symbiont of Bathyaustriella thionipta]|nr:glycine zipper 2TM domain-containing protein [gamma proteobacterium symbiont of Bathyaustriella thionipta]MCU7949092.1 glycine zipper 2TM domain-containing protein [gamma proteobacterium symbiont of Bathyaustriella thionipta]MCU7952788.1 glycine zipper 2TM domain-containing protein [gamma proteobacterium symbiont of Bathyaustriella thionipta]MCU7955679.1 glycine zipper 2TM domain-containing protein [gamma proteobacterium symbiont of Bathyaustriella thionipta]MCU7967993.1 glycine zipper 2TM d
MSNLKTCLFILVLFFNFSLIAHAEQEEQSTIVGSTIGAVAGSLLGYQFGGGTGQYVSTAIGAVGGYLLGGNIQGRMQQNQQPYEPEYIYKKGQIKYIGKDDYLIKQHLSDQRKRRNMIRNGEPDPMEMPYDVSEVQTSWDDPNN